MSAGPSLLERLEGRGGWRMTAQRRVVAEALGGDHVHLTPEEVFARARRHLPGLSLATVYNTLNELVALGEVRRVDVGAGRMRYDPNARPEHHHLVCLGCGEIHDVHPAGRARLPRAEQFGHRVVGVEMVFRGYCSRCRG